MLKRLRIFYKIQGLNQYHNFSVQLHALKPFTIQDADNHDIVTRTAGNLHDHLLLWQFCFQDVGQGTSPFRPQNQITINRKPPVNRNHYKDGKNTMYLVLPCSSTTEACPTVTWNTTINSSPTLWLPNIRANELEIYFHMRVQYPERRHT